MVMRFIKIVQAFFRSKNVCKGCIDEFHCEYFCNGKCYNPWRKTHVQARGFYATKKN